MGINIHLFNFLKYVSPGGLGSTVTIGRQEIDEDIESQHAKRSKNELIEDNYCERLLREKLGATVVESIDIDSYEGASIIHDFNLPIPMHLHENFDMVIDGGSLEHIYDIAQSFENCAHLVKLGGYIVHNLPFHNWALHGLYQFSPELFFQLYSVENGFTDTEIFIADINNSSTWYRFSPGSSDSLVKLRSRRVLSLLVKTRRSAPSEARFYVYQKFYVHSWNRDSLDPEKYLPPDILVKKRLKKFKVIRLLASKMYYFFRYIDNFGMMKNLKKYKVKHLLRSNN